MEQNISVYKRGASDGAIFGIIMIALFFSSIYVIDVPVLILVTILIMLAVPFVVYKFLRKHFVQSQGYATFSELWLHGIIIFACGSLISGLVAFIFLRWIQPDFMIDQMNTIINLYQSIGDDDAEEAAHLLQQMIDNKLVPTAIQSVIQTSFLCVFTGSILSMLVALIARSISIKN